MFGSVLDNVDFSAALASLVQTFPQTKANGDGRASGAESLAKAVRQRGGGGKLDGLEVYATAGSIGNLSPEFMLQMKTAMRGTSSLLSSFSSPPFPSVVSSSNHLPSRPPSWADITNIRVLWPSCGTGLLLNPPSLLGSGRAIPRDQWRTLPQDAKDRLFFDASPNPQHASPDNRGIWPGYRAVNHGKAILAVSSTDSVIYVGSHNFSKNAFGLEGGSKPANVVSSKDQRA